MFNLLSTSCPFGLKTLITIIAIIIFGILLLYAPKESYNNDNQKEYHLSSSTSSSSILSAKNFKFIEYRLTYLLFGMAFSLSALSFFLLLIGLITCLGNTMASSQWRFRSSFRILFSKNNNKNSNNSNNTNNNSSLSNKQCIIQNEQVV